MPPINLDKEKMCMKQSNPVAVLDDTAQMTEEAIVLTDSGETLQYQLHLQEIERLRSEVSRLTIERNMLRKTAVYFARVL